MTATSQNMPKISVIVPVYDVENFLGNCVESIINQTYTNLEIILVDDGTPDNSGAICDSYAAFDPRIKVIHKENGGLSDARNKGIDICTGDFIAFVDSDDYIDLRMYEIMMNAFNTYEGTDVVVCRHYISGINNDSTNRPSDIIFPKEEALNALLTLKYGNYAWNKLYRRHLWDDVRYPYGKKYEDVLTTYKIIQKADQVALIKEPLYFYRDNPDGIVNNPSINNAAQAFFARAERFDILEIKDEEVRGAMVRDMIRFLWPLRDSIFERDEAEFEQNAEIMSKITDFLNRRNGDFIKYSGWGRGGQFNLKQMQKGTRKGWVTARKEHDLFMKIKDYKDSPNAKDLIKNLKQFRDDGIYSYYCKMRKKPIDHKAAFLESRGGIDFASNIFYIAEELCKRGFKVYLSAWENDQKKIQPTLDKGKFPGLQFVNKLSKEYYKAAATSWLCFDDMCFNPMLTKREGQLWINPWHGIPLKTLGFDIIGQSFAEGGMAREFMACDYLTSSGDYYRDCMLQATCTQNIWTGQMLNTGYPRNAILCDKTKKAEIRKKAGIDDKEVFIYMPTWRGTFDSSADTDGEYEIDKILTFMDEHLKDNQIMYAKLHNLSAASINYDKYRRVLPFPKDFENYAFLNAADCLITDYSSVFYDYACTGGKIILFTYDREEYMAGRGTYMDFDILPFTRADNYEELAAVFNIEKDYDDSDFVENYCTYECADSVPKMLDFLMGGCKDTSLVESAKKNGKKNILVYDTDLKKTAIDPESTIEAMENIEKITGLSKDEANYFFCFRQYFMDSCPSVMKQLPEGWSYYGLGKEPTMTRADRRRAKFGMAPSKSWIKREIERNMWGQPFDDVVFIGNNMDDPYIPMLKAIKHD